MIEILEKMIKNTPYILVSIQNVSFLHQGHEGFGAQSHFEIQLKNPGWTSYKERKVAEMAIFAALSELYPSKIHSIALSWI